MSTDQKNHYAELLYWSSSYSFAVATLYLWGYWPAFGVNVLEYLNLTDVVKAAAYPVATIFLLLAIGAVIGEAILPSSTVPAGGGADTLVGRFLRKFAHLLLVLYACGTAAYFIFGSVEKWRIFPILIAIPLAFALKENGFLGKTVRSEGARTVMLLLLAALPFYAYGHGVMRASDVKMGRAFTYLLSPLEGRKSTVPVDPLDALRYVGKAGDIYFFFQPSNSAVILLPASQAKLLELIVFASGGSASSAEPRKSADSELAPSTTLRPEAPTPSTAASGQASSSDTQQTSRPRNQQ